MSKQIIKNGRIVEDNWRYIAEDATLPSEGKIILSNTRWNKERGSLQEFSGNLGVILDVSQPTDSISEELEKIDLIAVPFNEFKDGRGYSHARILRERYGFTGEIRAIGNVLRDQIYYLHRCGFDAFELETGRDLRGALAALSDFDACYQPAVVP